jgi:peroxiredoxin-like protein
MNTPLHFVSSAQWTNHRNGITTGHEVQPPIHFSSPPEFQGEPGVWTPEHFFTSAVAACFVTTFRAIAEYSHFEAEGLEVSVDGEVEKAEGGFLFSKITVRPLLTIKHESQRERGLRLLEKSEKACLVSRSLKSEIILEPQVVAASPVVV